MFFLLLWQIYIFIKQQEIFLAQQQAIHWHNHANTLVQQATGWNDPLLSEALSSYQKALEYRHYPDTKWNIDVLSGYLNQSESGTISSSITLHTGDVVDVYQQSNSSGQQIVDTTVSGSYQVTSGNGQLIHPQFTNEEYRQLQQYQAQLQKNQEYYMKDFGNHTTQDRVDDMMDGSLFEYFFGERNPFRFEIGDDNTQLPDW